MDLNKVEFPSSKRSKQAMAIVFIQNLQTSHTHKPSAKRRNLLQQHKPGSWSVNLDTPSFVTHLWIIHMIKYACVLGNQTCELNTGQKHVCTYAHVMCVTRQICPPHPLKWDRSVN